MRGYHTCQIVKTEHQRAEAARILRKAWIDCAPLDPAEQRFRIGDFSRSLLWRLAVTTQDPELLRISEEFYQQCLERDPSLPELSTEAKQRLRGEVTFAIKKYLENQTYQNEPQTSK